MGAAGRDEKAKGWLGRLGSGSISVGGLAWRESPAGANEVKREGAGTTPRHPPRGRRNCHEAKKGSLLPPRGDSNRG